MYLHSHTYMYTYTCVIYVSIYSHSQTEETSRRDTCAKEVAWNVRIKQIEVSASVSNYMYFHTHAFTCVYYCILHVFTIVFFCVCVSVQELLVRRNCIYM